MMCIGISDIMAIVQVFLGIFAIVVAWFIPRKIEWTQLYSQLLSDYYKSEFGAAVMGLVFFFYKDCERDVKNIKNEYVKRFKETFENQIDKKQSGNEYKIPNEQNLHYQRRLLTQFYYQLDLCSRSFFIGKRKIQKDFTSKEASLLKILYFMNEATSSPEIFMDISTDEQIPKRTKDINEYIKHLYDVLKTSKSYVR